MKKVVGIFVGIIICIALWQLPAANAQSSDPMYISSSDVPTKIAYVNIDNVIKKAKPAQVVIDKLNAELSTKQAEIDKKYEQYTLLTDDYKKKATILTEFEKERKKDEIKKLKAEIVDFENNLKKQSEEYDKEYMQPLIKKILEAVEKVGAEKNIGVILRSDGILYADKSLDITDEVVAYLNGEPISKTSGKSESINKTETTGSASDFETKSTSTESPASKKKSETKKPTSKKLSGSESETTENKNTKSKSIQIRGMREIMPVE